MILASWLMFIIGGCMIGFSPEEKNRVAQKRAARKRKYEQYLKEAELREKSKPKKEATYSKGPNMWVLGGLGALIAFPFAVILGMAKKYDD